MLAAAGAVGTEREHSFDRALRVLAGALAADIVVTHRCIGRCSRALRGALARDRAPSRSSFNPKQQLPSDAPHVHGDVGRRRSRPCFEKPHTIELERRPYVWTRRRPFVRR